MMTRRTALALFVAPAVAGRAAGQAEGRRVAGGVRRGARAAVPSLASALSRPPEELRAAAAQCLTAEEMARTDRIAGLLRAEDRAAVQQEWPLLMRDIRARVVGDAAAPADAPDAAIMLALQTMAGESLANRQAQADILAMLGEVENQAERRRGDRLDQLLQAHVGAEQTQDLGWLREVLAVLLLLLWLLDMTLRWMATDAAA